MREFADKAPKTAPLDDVFVDRDCGRDRNDRNRDRDHDQKRDRERGGGAAEVVATVDSWLPEGICDICVSEAVEIDPKLARKEAVNEMKKAHIMNAAVAVITRNGFADARLEDIAEEAGFSKASIYHYFPDKEALLINIGLREERAMYGKCIEVLERGLPFLETVKELIALIFNNQAMINNGAAQQHSNVGSMASFMSNIFLSMGKHEDLLNETIKFKINTNNLMRSVIEKARAAGILSIPLNDTAVCTMITSFIHSAVMGRAYHSMVKDEAVSAELAKIDLNWVINAITTFLEPWIKDNNNPHRRWYDVQKQ